MTVNMAMKTKPVHDVVFHVTHKAATIFIMYVTTMQ